ncbi:MAG: (Fe-S)-binding protein [Desulfobacterales bacterium]
MYNPKDIIDLIAANVDRTRNPFGIPKRMVNTWWKSAGLNRQGDTLLFTGLMYQFVPYIEKSTAYLARFEDSPWADYLRYGRYVPSRMAGAGLAAITPKAEKSKFNRILNDIAAVLTRSGVDFFYDPDLDEYSGVLLYDLGDQEGFERHARWLAAKFRRNGIRRLITVDPHTTYALKELYPEITGLELEVHPYFELLKLRSHNGRRQVTLHDPCFYGRYLKVSDMPSRLLADLGVECMPVRNAGLFTHCCGGPAESISPRLAGEVTARRMEDLRSNDATIVAMCPICLANLRKAGANVEDLSSVIARQTQP